MKNEVPHAPEHRHETAEAAPVVLHHDPDATILAQWLARGLQQGPKFWALIAGVVGVIVLLAVLGGSLSAGRTATDDAWLDVMLAKTPEDRLKAAETPSPAAPWALLQAAELRYQEAFIDLPANRDAALPTLTKAYDLFEQAYRKAEADSMVKRLAAMGMARTLETRGDVDGAIKQYESVAKQFPKTDEAAAEARITALRKPENRAFYEKFTTFKPAEVSLPPRGSSTFDGLGLPPNHPALNGPTIPAPGIPGLPTRPSVPPTSPADPTTPPAAPTPAETPKDEAKAKGDALPAAPFAGEGESKPAAPPK